MVSPIKQHYNLTTNVTSIRNDINNSQLFQYKHFKGVSGWIFPLIKLGKYQKAEEGE